ncbi:hypothetical protein G9A89_012292 [Geosiphon pyriformis]|nr:hypothetical protein G9A89_012292 [Geosiphon pyriformis]
MFMKKSVRDATTSSVNESLRQKPKILLEKVKHLGNETDLSFKLLASNSGQYKNIDTSSNEKLEHKMGKNMGYDTGNKNDGLLDSCTNTPKAKHFNSGIVKASSLSPCNFGFAIDDIDMDLSSLVFLEPSFHPVASVKKKLCFEPTKSFALNIGLLAVFRSTLCDKLKGVKKLFYKIDGFGGASISSKFSGTTAYDLSDLVQLYDKKICYISKNLVSYAQVCCAVIYFNFDNTRKAAICSTPVFKGVNLVWADKRHLVFIYAKKQAPMSYSVSFGNVTWASIISSTPKNLSSILFIETNLGIELVNDLTSVVMILALHISVLKCSLENVSNQMANISCKLDRLLAVLLASFIVLPTPEHNLVLDITANASLFVLSVPHVITANSQNISLNGSQVLTAKVSGLEANLLVLENSVKTILNKLDSFGSGSGVITFFLSQ